MFEQDDSSYPAWIMSAFQAQDHCVQCGCVLTLDDIFVVGLYPPTEVSGAMIGPMAGFMGPLPPMWPPHSVRLRYRRP